MTHLSECFAAGKNAALCSDDRRPSGAVSATVTFGRQAALPAVRRRRRRRSEIHFLMEMR